MKHLKTTMIMVLLLFVTVLLGVAGCDDDHRDRFRGDRDRRPSRDQRRDGDRHDDRRGDSGYDRGEHRDR